MSEKTPSADSELLNDPKKIGEDCRMIRQAIRNRWPIPPHLVALTMDRLEKVMRKDAVTAMTAEGPCQLECPADANAMRAAQVLVQMQGQNQADDHLADKNARMDAGKPTELTSVSFKPAISAGDLERMAQE